MHPDNTPLITKTTSACPRCGKSRPRGYREKLCLSCYKQNGRGPVVHREDGSTLLPLPHGEYTIIDSADFPLVRAYSWHRSGNGYVLGHVDGSHILLHRLIVGAQDISITDHRNRDVLDNRRSNLVTGNQSENMHNTSPRRGHRFKGVRRRKDTGRYRAFIVKDKKFYSLGCFDTEVEAAHAYNQAAIMHYGDRAVLNPMPDPPGGE